MQVLLGLLALLTLAAVVPKDVTIRQMFVDSNGDVLFESTDAGTVYFGNASGVYQLAVSGMCGAGQKRSLTFPEHGRAAEATFSFGPEGGHLECSLGGRALRLASAAEMLAFQQKLRARSVPVFALGAADRVPRYLFRMRETGQLIYVEAPRGHGFLRLWVGEPSRMLRKTLEPSAPEADVLRSREGDLLVVSRGKPPTWNRRPLDVLDLSTFELRSLGIPGVPNDRVSLSPCR